jgi:hypothetical protein
MSGPRAIGAVVNWTGKLRAASIGAIRSMLISVRQSPLRLVRAAALLMPAALPLLLLAGCSKAPEPSPAPAESEKPGAAVLRNLVASEELILALQQRLEDLQTRMTSEPTLPGSQLASVIFAPEVKVADVAPRADVLPAGPLLTSTSTWRVLPPAPRSGDWNFWQPLMSHVTRVERVTWSIVRGSFPASDRDAFDTDISLEALAWREKKPVAVSGSVKASWRRLTDGPYAWRIVSWSTEKLVATESPAPLFAEVFDSLTIEPAAAKARARRSLHCETVIHSYFGGQKPDLPAGIRDDRLFPDAFNEHPGLAVVDVEGDGDDDLYILERWGPSLFLRNDGLDANGLPRFTECAAALGLDVNSRSCAAVFADFDNDGDPDCAVGRSFDTSLLLLNDGGVFKDRTASLVLGGMPALVTSVSAADYNSDGLTDLYLCTSRPLDITTGLNGKVHAADGVPDWARQFLSPGEQEEVALRQKAAHGFPVQAGPPNILLVNRGGRFERAPEAAAVAGWRNSFQASWADYDDDGDPDLLFSNVFAPDVLYRNDGRKPDGSGIAFTDASAVSGVNHFGFGMGAGWGDYDQDGKLDLYVSSISSDASLRITAQVPVLDQRLLAAAEGNLLYHNTGEKFERVSGGEPPAIPVARAGWSWGGHFCDFDNDTYPDLYVSSGYYTAPPEVREDPDLVSDFWRALVRMDTTQPEAVQNDALWGQHPVTGEKRPEFERLTLTGPKLHAHSCSGSERNRFFLNLAGRTFADLSTLSGADDTGDSRAWVHWDMDRDGWPDIALVNANVPSLALYRNQLGAGFPQRKFVAVQLEGGSRTAAPQDQLSNRDGIGARILVETGGVTLRRDRQCGEGFAAQNSATMLIGIGEAAKADRITVRWPSRKTQSVENVAAGTLCLFRETDGSFEQRPYGPAAAP